MSPGFARCTLLSFKVYSFGIMVSRFIVWKRKVDNLAVKVEELSVHGIHIYTLVHFLCCL